MLLGGWGAVARGLARARARHRPRLCCCCSAERGAFKTGSAGSAIFFLWLGRERGGGKQKKQRGGHTREGGKRARGGRKKKTRRLPVLQGRGRQRGGRGKTSARAGAGHACGGAGGAAKRRIGAVSRARAPACCGGPRAGRKEGGPLQEGGRHQGMPRLPGRFVCLVVWRARDAEARRRTFAGCFFVLSRRAWVRARLP